MKIWGVRLWRGLFIGSLALFLYTSAASAASRSVVTTYKILPFGDSITCSVPEQASYRYWLDHMLHNGGISFQYAGSRTGAFSPATDLVGPPNLYSDYDPHNDGYSGAMAWDFLHTDNWPSGGVNTIDNILNRKINGTTIPNIPDIVLMHLGTNDISEDMQHPGTHDNAQITSDLGTIIDHIRAKNPNVIILLAQIIPSTSSNVPDARVRSLNAAIAVLQSQKNTAVSPVVLVDQYTGFNPAAGADTFDGTHPNQSGEQKMATKWYWAIYFATNKNVQRTFVPFVQ